jgi:hypothetical protein
MTLPRCGVDGDASHHDMSALFIILSSPRGARGHFVIG